jgi:HEAT repeat protein
MPRNIRWDESVQNNVLNLVEALLYKADDELDDLALKAAVHVEWVTANKLRVTGKQKQTRRKREQVIEVGTRKEHLVKLVNKTGKSLKLPQRKKESGSSLQERELAEVQTALDCLRELGVFEEEKNTRKNQGYWKFTLTLKHQTATREENLEVVRQKWKEHPKTNSLVTSSITPILETENSIDWRNTCRTMLEKQKQLTTNRLMRADEMLFDIDRIRVDLALVQRKQPDKRSEDDNPERSHLYKPDYEETQKLEYEDFLTKVLKSEQSKKVAIIGEPGAGKTTLLQRIAFWILENTDDLPIWIPLGNFPNSAPKFKDYLLNNWLEDAIFSVTPKIKDEFEERLMAGKVWLLLDGVDEMAAKSGSPLTAIANRIVGWCDRLRVVLTCRLNVWEANPYSLNSFQTYRTLEFTEEKVEEFINACFQKNDPELGIQLQQALNQPGKERIKDLVRNPLRLTLLCSTWHWREGKLPDTKAELYQQFVEEVYRWQDKEKEVPTITPEEREQLNAKLKELAVAAIDNETNRFCLRQKFVEGVFGDSSLFQLALNVGWLNQVGVDAKNPHQPVYAFFHPTFQEYFAALAIADWDFFLPRAHDNHNPKPVSKRYRIFEAQWKEVILLWLGREEVEREQKEEFIKALVEFEDGCGRFYWYRAYCLAAAGIAEFGDCSKADEIVAQIVMFCFGGFDTTKQKWVTFLEAIQSGAWAALQESARTKAITAIVQLLENSQNEHSRWRAAYGLGEIGKDNPIAIAALVQLIKNAWNGQTKFAAAESLEVIGANNPIAISALEKLLQNSSDEYVRHLAASSLEAIDKNNPVAITTFVQLVESSQNTITRYYAAHFLLNFYNKYHESASNFLVDFIQSQQAESTNDSVSSMLEKRLVISMLEKIDDYNPTLKASLVKIKEKFKDESTSNMVRYNSKEVEKTHLTVKASLVEFIQKIQNEDTPWEAVYRLKNILTKEQMAEAVTTLKNYLLDENHISNFDLNRYCHEVIFHCIQQMYYPNFYQAWNIQSIDSYQNYLEIQRLLNDRQGEANCLFTLGTLYRKNGKFWEGQTYIQQAIEILQKIDAPIDAYPIHPWMKSAIKFAQRSNLVIGLSITLMLTIFALWLISCTDMI